MAEITIRISDRVLKVTGAILIGVCVLWVISNLWSSGFFRPKYRLRMYVNEVAGLGVGAPVRADEVDVGKVERVSLARNSNNPETKIELILCVEKRYQDLILDDSTATLGIEGLLGERFVNIVRGTRGVPLTNNAQIAALPNREIKAVDLAHSVLRFADCMKEVESPSQSANPAKGKDSARVPK
ncbi:MAG: MlaD family protein [Candidatus Acidiferrales bacterium]